PADAHVAKSRQPWNRGTAQRIEDSLRPLSVSVPAGATRPRPPASDLPGRGFLLTCSREAPRRWLPNGTPPCHRTSLAERAYNPISVFKTAGCRLICLNDSFAPFGHLAGRRGDAKAWQGAADEELRRVPFCRPCRDKPASGRTIISDALSQVSDPRIGGS